MPVELKVTGENTTELLIHISELGDIARAILGGVSTPPTPTDTIQRIQQDLDNELREVLAENGEVANDVVPAKPAKGKGGRPRKAAAPAPVEEEEDDDDPLGLLEDEKASPPKETPEEILARVTNMLSVAYHAEGGIPHVKALLEKYGVKKFSHLPVERADELLVDATKIQEAVA